MTPALDSASPAAIMPPPANHTALLARIVLGGMFVALGAVKALDPVAFLKTVHAYGLVDSSLALNGIAALLPWFEIFCGALLVAGIRPRAAALLQLGLLAGFTAAVVVRAHALARVGGLPFCAVAFDCGCGTGEVRACFKILENAGLAALAAFVAFRPNHHERGTK